MIKKFSIKSSRSHQQITKVQFLVKVSQVLLVLVCLLLTAPNPAIGQTAPELEARSDAQLSVSPPTAFIKLKPGSKTTHTITLENTGSQTVRVKPVFYDFKSDGQTGLPQLQNQFSFPYLDIPPSGFPQVTIPARGKGQLTLMFTPPMDAQEGEYPFTVVFESEPGQVSGLTTIGQGIGSNLIVLVTNQDQTAPSLSIDQLKTSRIVDSFRPLGLEVLIKNNGLSSQVASGSATLKNWRGELITSFTLYPDIVLGNSTRLGRSLHVNPQSTADDNPYSAGEFVAPAGFRLGLYTWEVKLGTDTSNYKIKTVQVVAVPVLLIVLTLVGGGLLIWWTRLNRQKTKLKP